MIKPSYCQVIGKNEREFYPNLLHTSVNRCPNESVCNTNQQIQHLVVISAKHSVHGQYFLKVIVTYENETIETYTTTLKYSVEEKGISYELICTFPRSCINIK